MSNGNDNDLPLPTTERRTCPDCGRTVEVPLSAGLSMSLLRSGVAERAWCGDVCGECCVGDESEGVVSGEELAAKLGEATT